MKLINKIVCATFVLLSSTAYSQEFLGIKLENTNAETLNSALEKAGGKLVKNKSNKLVNIYVFKESPIPSISNAVTYWNENGEWVGLRVGFEYHAHNNFGLRKNLVDKYGLPNKTEDFHRNSNPKEFLDKNFFNKAYWNMGEVELEVNADTFKDKIDRDIKDSIHVAFKHKKRTSQLKNNINTKIDKVDKEKWKGVF